jgi:hypothetical protein
VRMPWPLYPSVLLRWPDNVVATGHIASSDKAGWVLHRLSFGSADAEIIRSYGPELGELRPGPTIDLRHVLAPRPSERAWSADRRRYRLYEWSLEGDLVRTLDRSPSWYRGVHNSGFGDPKTEPPPTIAAIQTDSAGRLWVFVRLPSTTWRTAWPASARGQKEVRVSEIAIEKLFRTLIEVIDPKSARVIARRTLDAFIFAALGGGLVAAYTADENGVSRIRVLRAGISGR